MTAPKTGKKLSKAEHQELIRDVRIQEFKAMFMHKSRLRTATQDFSVTELQTAVSKLNSIIDERSAMTESIKQIETVMQDFGVSLDDLIAYNKGTMPHLKIKTKRPPKYKIVDEEGIEHVWTGMGITPVVFRDYMNKHSLTKEDLPAA